MGREAIASKDCTGTLVEQFYAALDFILNSLTKSFTIKKIVREEKLEIPQIAIREILLNAVVHRNYHMRSPIKVAIYENRIEIFSPGNFAGPIKLQNIGSGFTYWQNTAICKIFKELGIIEMIGTGFITVFSSYEKAGLPTPQIIEGEGYIKCILPRPSRSDLVKKRPKSTEESYENKTIFDLLSKASHVTISDVIDTLKVSRATAGRRIAQMTKKGLIEKVGAGKGTSYIRK